MLSRIAEAFYWIGRYVERADDTARILRVHLRTMLEDPWVSEDDACRALLTVMGTQQPDSRRLGRHQVLHELAYSNHPSAITGALSGARENARRARETVSPDLYELLNVTWHSWTEQTKGQASPYDLLQWIQRRATTFGGIVDSTMSRDQTWDFLVAGRSLERADMTARMVLSRLHVSSPGMGRALLRAIGAHETFMRQHRAAPLDDDILAIRFVLADAAFPRSLVHALRQAGHCINNLYAATPTPPYALSSDDPRRTMGRIRTQLEYADLEQQLRNGTIVQTLLDVQSACAHVNEGLRDAFFPRDVQSVWTSEAV